MPSQLEQLKKFTTVAVDTVDFNLMKKLQLENAMTDASLILNVSKLPQYAHFVEGAIAFAKNHHRKYAEYLTGSEEDNMLDLAVSKLMVMIGVEISALTPGRVSVDMNLRYMTSAESVVERATLLIRLLEDVGMSRNRIYVNISATWEGIRAAKTLEKLNINCNLTLVFSLVQAVACAQAGVSQISLPVGSVLDWHMKNHRGKAGELAGAQDPGVVLVRNIYSYYRQHGYKTAVMGTSFSNKDEILELAGCDKLAISPSLLEELSRSKKAVERKLDPSCPHANMMKLDELTEADYQTLRNKDEIAVAEFTQALVDYSKDANKVRDLIQEKLNKA